MNKYKIEVLHPRNRNASLIDQEPAKIKAPAIVKLSLSRSTRLESTFSVFVQNMSKVYVETLPKHKQLSEDMSDKDISVM